MILRSHDIDVIVEDHDGKPYPAFAPSDPDDLAIVEAALALLESARARRDAREICEALGALSEVALAHGAFVWVGAKSLLALVPEVRALDGHEVGDATLRLMLHEQGLELLDEHGLAAVQRTVDRYRTILRGAQVLEVEPDDVVAALLAHDTRGEPVVEVRP